VGVFFAFSSWGGGGGKELDDSSRLDVVENRARPLHAPELVSFLVGLTTYLAPWYNVKELFYWLYGVCFVVYIRLIDVNNYE